MQYVYISITYKMYVMTYSTCIYLLIFLQSKSDAPDSEALSIVSYIGCAISIICLLFTIVAIIILRYVCCTYYTVLFTHSYVCRLYGCNKRSHFVHLNLSIALLLGLITFVSGIETADKYRVSDNSIFQVFIVLFRKAVLLWLYCFITSSWQHFAGCLVKECCYLFC